MKKILFILLFISINYSLIGQGVQEGLKRQALIHMNNKKYGEAIDLLNKYISKNAQVAEGYNLRALCFQKRAVYENAHFDFRRARRLEPSNPEFIKNEQKLREEWNPILYDKIEGNKRNIAVEPDNAFYYLEIGKAYRWLEEWSTAEYWYDEYLARDDNASPDEVIRYTLILQETGNLTKGERILKKYVERYPEDWRLWSRYGYFTLWLGKYKISEKAFSQALFFKPFFKEASDGLDQARKQGYIIVQHEGDYNYSQNEPREYPIDRYFRKINRNPSDSETRFLLIGELIPAERYEEAYQQLKYLKKDFEGTEKFDAYYSQVTQIREETYGKKIEENLLLLKNDPTNKDALIKIAGNYVGLEKYDEADELLSEYLELVPNDTQVMLLRAKYLSWIKEFTKASEILANLVEIEPENREAVDMLADFYAADYDFDASLEVLKKYLANFDESKELDVRFKLARYLAWNYDWDDARDEIEILLKYEPDNLDYQLLFAQVTVWTVDDTEFPRAEEYLNNVLASDEKNIFALLGMSTIRSWQRNLEDSKKYIDLAKKYHPGNPDIETTENFYNAQIMVAEDIKNLKLREEAAELAQNDDCAGALNKLHEYFAQVENPDYYAYMEYANTYMCAGDYNSAIAIYDTLLSKSQNFDVAMQRAKAYLYVQDTLKARQAFKNLVEEQPDNYYARMFLGDTYLMTQDYGRAESIYEDLLSEAIDTEEKEYLNQRLISIPPYGFNKVFSGVVTAVIPYAVSIIPTGAYYNDNQNLQYYNYGGRFEMGFARYFRAGISYLTTRLQSSDNLVFLKSQYFTSLMGNLYVSLSEKIVFGGGLGRMNIEYEKNKNVGMLMARYEDKDHLGVTLMYEDDDVRRSLPSPRMLGVSLDSYSYLINAYYIYNNNVKFEYFYRYIGLSDNNEGNDFRIRLGKLFKYNVMVGYEYSFSDYKYNLTSYYSPNKFDTHSIWADWKFNYNLKWDVSIGGKIGYAPTVDYVLSELYSEAKYEIIENLFANGRIGVGNSFRFDSSYRFISAFLSVYWSFF
ncbi:MAG: hypothetical protein CVV23_06320 [Ignavibacteriae bacterium HGW-Ignavibacteriae-2]|jgi:tetratricopeptide (TPR) repeat protein|nr:MAG: hypothetical protein CVV23_06320 [Ignavibacteriae bacterium HGW-Ignavibacteriae-2]